MSGKSSISASETDWNALETMSDEQIDTSDIPPIAPARFANAVIRTGQETAFPQHQVTLQIDADVLAWFQATGQSYPRRINTILRAYKEAHSHG
ncbi:MAG: BrnA antitoxin family protein [Magnetococcales bacterium]|nr:BrnA antitoxin family protein [Magnetococcales bacterium]